MRLQKPLSAVLQQLEAVITGDIPEDRECVLHGGRGLRAGQSAPALVAIPPQVASQHLHKALTHCLMHKLGHSTPTVSDDWSQDHAHPWADCHAHTQAEAVALQCHSQHHGAAPGP